MTTAGESFTQLPLQQIPPSYLYTQYSDDDSLQAFVQAYNGIMQGYLQWFNDTPLGLYTSPNINGTLLDWTAQGIYGVNRPVVSSSVKRVRGGFGSRNYGTNPYGTHLVQISGVASIANDDYYKRTLTWCLYQGDADNIDITWLKKRIARFLYGPDGSDVSADMLNMISIMPNMMVPNAGYATRSYGKKPAYGKIFMRSVKSVQLSIKMPDIPSASVFIAFINQGILPMPIQVSYVNQLAFVLNQSSLNQAAL